MDNWTVQIREEKGDEGIEEAWAAAVAALPRDAWIYDLSADSFLGHTHPGGWVVRAHVERNGWQRHWVTKYAAADRDG